MRRKRLLIIDDDPMVCKTLQHMAEFSGFEVISTDSQIAFFAQLTAFEPDVIIVDLMLPGQDGVQLIHQLAEINSDAQLIIVSGLDIRVLESAADSAREHGMSVLGVLSKPVSVQRLRQLLTLYLTQSERRTGTDSRDQSMAANDWMPTLDDLLLAIDNDELTLEYLPKLDCRSGALLGFEALARWQDKTHGKVRPSVFIPLAENNGLISELTVRLVEKGLQWLRQLADATELRAAGVDVAALTMAFNVTGSCLQDEELPGRLEALCQQYGISPARVTLEISESHAMTHPVRLLDALTRLRIKHFNLSIDDFGTGFSSMLHLVRLPFTEIKIDREFVKDAETSEEAQSVIRCIIDLARSLNMTTVAEGVETQKTRLFLLNHGCQSFQGYLISRPLSAEQVQPWLLDYSRQLKP